MTRVAVATGTDLAAKLAGQLAKVVATTNVPIAGLPVIDGYQTLPLDEVLLTAQTVPAQNGPWVVGAGAWARPASVASGTVLAGGTAVVTGGAANAGTVWTLTTTGTVMVDATPQVWVSAPAAGVAAALATKLNEGVLVINMLHPSFGVVTSTTGAEVDATTGMQAALNATPVGLTCFAPPLPAGRFYKFSALIVPPGVELAGGGWQWLRDNIGTFGLEANVDRTNYTGSVLVSTATSGSGITCATSVTTKAGRLRNLLVVGPGTDTAIGVSVGTMTHSPVGCGWDGTVGIINFADALVLQNVNDAAFWNVTVRGCTRGVSCTQNTNNCAFFLLDCQQCTDGVITDSTTLANAFYSPIGQGNVGTSFKIDGRLNVIDHPYCENAAGVRAIDIVGGSGNKVDSPMMVNPQDTLRVTASAARTQIINPSPNSGQPINNAGAGTILIGEASTLVDTGTGTIILDGLNGRAIAAPLTAGLSTGIILSVQTPVAQMNWNSPGVYAPGFFHVRNFSSAAQNAGIEWDADFAGGTYSFDLFHTADTDGGIYTISVAGVIIGTVDGYSDPTTETKSTLASVAVTPGRHRVKLLMATKSGPSSAYRGNIQAIAWTRTGA